VNRGAQAAVAIAAIVAGCATGGSDDESKRVGAERLAPYAMHEACAELAAGERLEYRFDASAPVNFDIHYHDGGAVVEPVVREGVTQGADVFVPLLAQHYCLMWQAGPAGATLDYRMRVRRAPH
jgi:hypothetical protein